MATFLYYNNKQILSGQPTPTVERQDAMIRYGERWAEQTTITLNGQITGCLNNFSGLVENQQRLIDIFSQDFQEFQIVENGNLIYNKPYSIIKGGVEFPQSNYVGILNYRVSLECYHENLFSGFFGVLDPKNNWRYDQKEDGVLEIVHSIEARGFNTNSGASNAFDNAKQFVLSKTGVSEIIYPTFIPLPTGAVPCLREIKEDKNRMVGTYSVEMVYQYDLYNNAPGILRYGTEFVCDNKEGVAGVTVDGHVESCHGEDITDLRNRYNAINIYGLALEAYQDATSNTDLNSEYLSSGVTEDTNRRLLSFNVSFDNYTGSNTILDYKVAINSGQNDIINVDFDGTISARGDIKTRWDRVSGYYSTLNPYSLANPEFIAFGGGTPPLNTEPVSSGVTFNKFAGTISTNVSWNNKEIPVAGFKDFNYAISYTPSIQKVIAKPLATNINGPICGNGYAITDLGHASRSSFSINGDGIVKCGNSVNVAIANLKSFVNDLFEAECPQKRALLEENKITTGVNQRISFNFSWSAESENNVVSPRNTYNQINELSLI